RHSPRVHGLAGGEPHAGLPEDADRLGGGGHVGALGDDLDAVLHQAPGVGAVELVLGGAGERDVAGHLPDRAALDEGGQGAASRRVFADPAAVAVLDLLEQVQVDPGLVDDIAVG